MTDRRIRNSRLSANGTRSSRRMVRFVLAAIGTLLSLVLFAWGVATLFDSLHDIANEQCRVTDPDLDVVVVTPGRMVQPDVVTLHFGLTNGSNLAKIDFATLREKLLSRVPNVRDIHIERRLPNRVTIEVKERDPIARVAGKGCSSPMGLMVDSEGVIFRFARSAATYPVIRTESEVKLAPGERLAGRSASALQLIETAAQPELLTLNVQEVDATPKDYMLVTLGNYSRAKIAWEGMDTTSSRIAHESLRKQLTRLKKAFASNLASPTATWIATDYGTPGRVYAAANDR